MNIRTHTQRTNEHIMDTIEKLGVASNNKAASHRKEKTKKEIATAAGGFRSAVDEGAGFRSEGDGGGRWLQISA